MRHVDDGPDGLNEKAFDRALGIAPVKPKRVRKFDAMKERDRLLDQWSAHRKRHGCSDWPGAGCPVDQSLLDAGLKLVRAECCGMLFDFLREACRG